jgi:hypothetical protein
MTDEMLTKFENVGFLIMTFGYLLILSLLKEEDMLWGIIGLLVGAFIGYVTAGLLSGTDEQEDDDDGQ